MQKIKCIDAKGTKTLTRGRLYECEYTDSWDLTYLVICNDGIRRWIKRTRFVTA